MKNPGIRTSIAAHNGIRAQISGIFWEQKCSFPRPSGESAMPAGSFRGFPAGEPRFIKKGTGQRRAPSDRYAPGPGAMRTARGEERGSPCPVTDVKSTFFQILRRTKKTTRRALRTADVEGGRAAIPLEKPPSDTTWTGPGFQGFASRFQESGVICPVFPAPPFRKRSFFLHR